MAMEALSADQLLMGCKEGDKLHLMFQFDLYCEPHLLLRSMELQVLRHDKLDGGFHDISFACNNPFRLGERLPTNLRFYEMLSNNTRCINVALIGGEERVYVVRVFDVSKFKTDITPENALLDVDTEVRLLAPEANEMVNRIKEAVERYKKSKTALGDDGDSTEFKRFFAYRPITSHSVDPPYISEANGNLTRFAEENATRIIGRFFKP